MRLFFTLSLLISFSTLAENSGLSLIGDWKCKTYELGEGDNSFVIEQYVTFGENGQYAHKGKIAMKTVPEFWFIVTSLGGWELDEKVLSSNIIESKITSVSMVEAFSDESLFLF